MEGYVRRAREIGRCISEESGSTYTPGNPPLPDTVLGPRAAAAFADFKEWLASLDDSFATPPA